MKPAKENGNLQSLYEEIREWVLINNGVPNPDVEEGTSSPVLWNAGSNTEWSTVEHYRGTRSLRLHPTAGQGDWRSDKFHAKDGNWYRFRVRVKGTGDANTKATIRFFTSGDVFISEVDIFLTATYASWTALFSDCLAPANTAKADVMLRQTSNGTVDIYVDCWTVTPIR